MPDTPFPQLPEDLAALDDAELATLHDEFQTAGRSLVAAAKARDPEVLGDRTQQQVEDELAAGALALSKIRSEQESRTEGEAEFEARLATHADVFGADAGDGDDEPETDETEKEEPEAEADAETETARAASAATLSRGPLPAARRHKPVVQDIDSSGFKSQIRVEALGVGYGDTVEGKGIGELLHHVVRRGVANPGTKLSIATARFPFPAERNIAGQLVERENPRVRDVVAPEALTASGEICAMPEPIYDVNGVSIAARPVRDALPSFQANRGAVITRAAPLLGDYAGAVGVITAADNAEAGSLAVKPCMRIICPETAQVDVDTISVCLEADNLASRSDPELMAAIDRLTRAEQARVADGKLLDGIKSGSTAVAGASAGDGGAVYGLLGDIFKAAAGYRSRHRMPEGAVLNAIFPAWTADLIALDVARAVAQMQPLNRDGVLGWLRGKGIAPTFHLDGTSDASDGQIFDAQGDGAILDFPDSVEWFLFAPGTWLHLDAGTLDLGVVRDSTLNATNDFQIFAETWENVAFVGVESLVITSDVCPSGTFAGGVDLSGTC